MKLKQLADSLGLGLRGDPDTQINRLADIQSADEGSLSFVVGARLRNDLLSCRASAVIVPEDLADDAPCACLVSSNPYLSYAQASHILYPYKPLVSGPAVGACVAADADVQPCAEIGPNAVITSGSTIGQNCVIGAGTYIGESVTIGANCRIGPNVTICHGTSIGSDCRVHPGAVIGADGFGFAPGPDGWVHIRQIGRVLIGDRVDVGANTTIDRGAIGDTVIGNDVILDNQIQVAHNVHIGDYTAIAGCVGIAGSTVIGRHCRIGGKTAIVGHITIADNVTLTATSFVSRSITEPGTYSSGMPLQKNSDWRRTFVRLSRLDEIVKDKLRKKP